MAVGITPIFVLTPIGAQCRISTANTNRDGTGTLGTLVTAGAYGGHYDGFRWQAEGSTTAGVIRLFIQKGGSGNIELIREMLVTAISPSTTIEAISGEWFPTGGITLGAGDVVKVGTQISETFSCWLLHGGDF